MIREAVSAAPPVLAAPDPVAVRRSNDPGSAKTVRYDLLMQQWQGEEWMRPDSPYQILPVTPKELQRGRAFSRRGIGSCGGTRFGRIRAAP